MCGITGFIDFQKKGSKQTLEQITALLNHRGPNDTGHFFVEKESNCIGLGHKRLSIIDVSSCGHQPMHYEHLTLIFNGEVYNYAAIKEELSGLGYTFNSTSDTEVVLKSFHAWDVKAFDKFIGMFAIGLYDQRANKLYLVRDRIGVKPLFYYLDEDKLVFASELKAILAYPGVAKKLNYEALNIFLHHGYIPSPLSIFENVQKLQPGTYLCYQKRQITCHTYWDLKDQFIRHSQDRIYDESSALTKLDELVNDAVKYRMVADVPIGAFLSGGYDSSLVAAIMQHNSSQPIKTFTVGFHEPDFNEATYAKRIAEYLKTDHYEKYLHVDDALSLIEKIPLYFDEPFADSSQLPTMLVSQIAKEKVTVVLSGDGGDELFCGYEHYDEIQTYWKNRSWFQLISYANKILPIEQGLSRIDLKYKKILHLNSLDKIINHRYLLAQYYLDGLVRKQPFGISALFSHMLPLSDNPQEASMLQDMLTYLPDDIMAKVDRATMSVSLEGREPLLDHRLFEFSFQLAHQLKYNAGQKKYLLKKLAHKYIPAELLDRPKKGFSLPIHQWLKQNIHYLIDENMNKEFIQEQGIFSYPHIKAILEAFYKEKTKGKYSTTVWNLIVFQMWYRQYH